MQRTHLHRTSHNQHMHVWTLSKTRLLEIALVLTAVILLATLKFPEVMRAVDPLALVFGSGQSTERSAPSELTNAPANSSDRTDSLAVFEQTARQLARTGSKESFQTLVGTLRQDEPETHRDISMALLKDASPAVVPVLLEALSDSDPGVRAGAAQVLGMRREYPAVSALTAATHDPKWRVRRQAAQSLGEIYAWQSLPRLEQLRVNEGNLYVRQAADLAVAKIRAEIGKEIGAPDSRVVDVSITTSDSPRLYAVTDSDLYTRHGITWKRVSRLPDNPVDLAAGLDEKVVYLAVANSGLYRSRDGGVTWEQIEFGAHTPTQLRATAIAVNPRSPRQLFAALAAPSADPGRLDPVGVCVSLDAGDTWTWLEDSPMFAITTRLVLDPDSPGYLFGEADDTPWRYRLQDDALDSPSS